jgi:hypothetical protein
MRATSQFAFAALLGAVLLVFAFGGAASAVPSVSRGLASTSDSASNGLVEQARTYRKRKVRRGYRRPYYAPYFCSQPYQYRYWMFYAPICRPL